MADLRARRARCSEFELPPIDDRSGILASIAEVLQRIAACAIDNKRAGLLLYGLQLASLNLPPADQPIIEDFITDPELGDLAPEAELKEDTTQAPHQSEAEPEPAVMDNIKASGAPSVRALSRTGGNDTLPQPPPGAPSSRQLHRR